MNSKFIGAMVVLTTLLLGAATVFQMLEMKEYNLFSTLQSRFFGGAQKAPAPAAETPAAPAQAADAQ